MRSSTTVGSRSSVGESTIASTTPRLFDHLNATSKEKVTLLLSRIQALLPIEQDAFLQELARQQGEAQHNLAESNVTRGKLVRYTGPSLEAVQARDRGYVVPRHLPSNGRAHETLQGTLPKITVGSVAHSDTHAALPCSLEELVGTPGMFGDQDVAIHLEKVSLYDKLHQNMVDTKGATATPEGSGDLTEPSDAAEKPMAGPAAPQNNACNAEKLTLQAPTEAPVSHTRSSCAPYRSNAYQAVRLAMSAPGYIASQRPTSMAATQTGHDGVQSVLNTTGMPINEDDLREWFDELDEEGRGALSLEEFRRCMVSLERDFGVTQEYAALQRAGEQLAFDGHLSFEAFAYLVLRFVRV